MFTLEELASYPGTDGIPESTALLLRDLAVGLIDEVAAPEFTASSIRAKGIALEVVARAYRNPGGFSSETVDDYTYRRASSTGTAGVYLTSEERSALTALVPNAPRSRVRSQRLRSWSGPL